MQVVQAFYVGGVAASVFGVDLDLTWVETGSFGVFGWDSDSAIWIDVLREFGKREVAGDVQFMPKESHAASTSGPASRRKSLRFMNEPLNRTSW